MLSLRSYKVYDHEKVNDSQLKNTIIDGKYTIIGGNKTIIHEKFTIFREKYTIIR